MRNAAKRIFHNRNRPMSEVAREMERDWNARARENPRHYVATSQQQWQDETFLRSGSIWVHDYVLTDLTVICNGRFPSDMRVLEIGCGAGRLLPALSRLFGEVHGVDVSSEMLREAEAVVANTSNIRLHKNNGYDLSSFEAKEFDFIFSAIVFQHVPQKSIVENYIREAYRVLRPGSVFKCQFEGHPIPEHVTDTWRGVSFSEKEVHAIARKCGFEIVASTGAGTQYFWVTFLKPAAVPKPYRPHE
jgi:ubiquinone/menaquinone biosynthesis C-methylase UbiE